ncbi:glycosyl transferase, group 2 family protein [Rhodobacteraceae bacterium HTCC2150]|nr:glycosyl transferase, group 2 family protein [Rhodobacteraceae bacterium HTCC2150]
MPLLSIIIPAHNEGNYINDCLSAVFASQGLSKAQVIVVANGCTDDTVETAKTFTQVASQMGWELIVLNLPEGHKPTALNAGDAAASGDQRAYLDADTIVSKRLLAKLHDVLTTDAPRYASGLLTIPRPKSWVSQAYARIYRQVPFIRTGVPGAGLFAVNSAGRARWGAFPNIISDDTFVRLQFTPSERMSVSELYFWPIVEGFSNLIRVRRRQNAGVAEVEKLFPELTKNSGTAELGTQGILSLAIRHPIGFVIYAAVSYYARPDTTGTSEWDRGR